MPTNQYKPLPYKDDARTPSVKQKFRLNYGMIWSETYPVAFFGFLFLLMVTIPLVFTGVLSIYAFGIGLGVILAVAVFFMNPLWLGIYFGLLTILVFVFVPYAWHYAWWVAILVLAYLVVGMFCFPKKKPEPSFDEQRGLPAHTYHEAAQHENDPDAEHPPTQENKFEASQGDAPGDAPKTEG